jgi:hypothetical protein
MTALPDATMGRFFCERPLRLLALRRAMVELKTKGNAMIQDPEYSRRLAQNLLELLSPYEEELIQLERDIPAFAPLRRAVGIVIAEACYAISDRPVAQDSLVPPMDDQAEQTR